jgi:hypothetical protein
MDILSICHFLIYFVLAFFIKEDYVLITIIGISWELFEYSITNIPLIRDFLIKYWPLRNKWMLDNNGINVPWMTEQIKNRIEDLLFNTLGYVCGTLLICLKNKY